MVEAFKQWRVYVEGAAHPVCVYTDHKNLEYFSTTRTTSRRHARWAATLVAHQYTITYKKGANNGKLDALSRRPDYSPPPLPSLSIFHTPHLLGAAVVVSPDDPLLPAIAAAQAGDITLSAIIKHLQGGPGGESNPALLGGRPYIRTLKERAS